MSVIARTAYNHVTGLRVPTGEIMRADRTETLKELILSLNHEKRNSSITTLVPAGGGGLNDAYRP